MERLRASTPPKGTTTKKWNEVLDRHYPRVVQKVKSDQLAWVQKLRNQPVPDGLSHDDWHWIIDDAAEAIENPPSRMNAEEEGYYESLREEAEAVEEYFKDLKYLQSSAVTTRSQERFPLMQREQRPEDKSTRHSEPADLHREQGVGITPPRSDTLQDNREARSVDDGGALYTHKTRISRNATDVGTTPSGRGASVTDQDNQESRWLTEDVAGRHAKEVAAMHRSGNSSADPMTATTARQDQRPLAVIAVIKPRLRSGRTSP
jgi:hypothetical protein